MHPFSLSKSSPQGFLRLAALLVLALQMVSCGRDSQNSAALTCGPEDQRGAYFAPLGNAVTVIKIDNEFNESEFKAIREAAESWNSLGQVILGRPFFAVEKLAVPVLDGSLKKTAITCANLSGTTGSFMILKFESNSQWSVMGLGSDNPGVTIRCERGDELERQIILLHGRYADQADFKSVVLHELGHAAGLNHSCDSENAGKEDYIGCNQIDSAHAYRHAAMYPYLRKGSAQLGPEIKTALTSNDQERTSCRYGK